MIIGYSGKDSALAKSFILQYKKSLDLNVSNMILVMKNNLNHGFIKTEI